MFRQNAAMASAPATNADVAPWEWLYDLVGVGMWAFVNARFRVEILGERLPRVAPGQLWVSTHRAETDVPLVAGMLFARAGMWRHHGARIHFAARDDLFEQGIVTAGLPLPRPAARALWRLTPGPWLPRVRVHPVRRPTGLKLGQVLRDVPGDTALEALVGPRIDALIRERAGTLRRPEPHTVADVNHPDFARVLWQDVGLDDLVPPLGHERWRAHIARAAGDLRRLVRLVADGAPLLLYPEGRVSPDGSLGAVGELVEVIARRGRPRTIIPIGIAYDPVGPRRTTVAVGIGPSLDGDTPDTAAALAERLRTCTPVTTGQAVCGLLASRDGDWTPAALAESVRRAVAACGEAGRPLVRALTSPQRDERVGDVVRTLERRSVVERSAEAVTATRERLLADPVTARLVREWEGTMSSSPGSWA